MHIAAWQVGYRHVFGAALDDLSLDGWTGRWATWFAEDNQSVRHLVAEVDSRIVGVANAGPARDDDATPTEGELYALYVHPDHWGTGVAQALLDEATTAFHALGCTSATLWVLDDNPRARRFYERAGWRPDGTARTGEHLGVATHEVRYRIEL